MSERTPTQAWLVAWFARMPGWRLEFEADSLTLDYYRAGVLDSHGAIQLLEETERHFGIRFSHAELQDSRFGTIGGLAEIVEELLSRRMRTLEPRNP